MQTLFLISCTGQKVPGKQKAIEKYMASDWFRKARAYAETVKGSKIMILSALHGLLDSETEIDDYDMYLAKQKKIYRVEWAQKVLNALTPILYQFDEIVILAGSSYREFLTDRLDVLDVLKDTKKRVEIPLKGLGIGEQKSFLKKAVEEFELNKELVSLETAIEESVNVSVDSLPSKVQQRNHLAHVPKEDVYKYGAVVADLGETVVVEITKEQSREGEEWFSYRLVKLYPGCLYERLAYEKEDESLTYLRDILIQELDNNLVGGFVIKRHWRAYKGSFLEVFSEHLVKVEYNHDTEEIFFRERVAFDEESWDCEYLSFKDKDYLEQLILDAVNRLK